MAQRIDGEWWNCNVAALSLVQLFVWLNWMSAEAAATTMGNYCASWVASAPVAPAAAAAAAQLELLRVSWGDWRRWGRKHWLNAQLSAWTGDHLLPPSPSPSRSHSPQLSLSLSLAPSPLRIQRFELDALIDGCQHVGWVVDYVGYAGIHCAVSSDVLRLAAAF